MDVIPMTLDRVVDRSGQIVHGTVTSVVSGRDESGLPATWVSVAVMECLKGQAAGTVTFKQIGVAAPLADGTLLRIPGLPRYREGGEYVLFLHDASARGFTSPVGFEQGVYDVERSREGTFARSKTKERLALSAFLAAVRSRTAR